MQLLFLSLFLIGRSFQYPQPVVDLKDSLSPNPRGHDVNLLRRSPQATSWSAWPSSDTSIAGGSPTAAGSTSISTPTVVPSGNIIDDVRNTYLFPVTVEGQTFNVELDTGSSDLWFPQTGFKCYQSLDPDTQRFTEELPPEDCDFEKTYTPGNGFGVVATEPVYMWACYGSSPSEGRCAVGRLGQANVQIGDVTVSNQFIGAITDSSFKTRATQGESGILGLAFNSLTSGFYTSNNESFPYSSVMNTLFNSGAVEARQFSMALSRDEAGSGNGGIFTIGGIPDIHSPLVNVSTDWYSSKSFEYVSRKSSTEYSYYAMDIDSFFVDGQTYDSGLQVIVDSGYNIFMAPLATAQAMNDLWVPPPSGDVDGNGNLFIECNSVYDGVIGINLGGRTFFVDPADLVIDYGAGCVSLIRGVDGSNGYVIGDPFLKNVLAVFNWDREVMSFYPRQHYLS